MNKPLALVLLAALATACADDSKASEPTPPQGVSTQSPLLEASLARWRDQKSAAGGAYRYVIRDEYWNGWFQQTTVSVANDRVMARRYESGVVVGPDGGHSPFVDPARLPKAYQEEGDAIGTHEAGRPPKTVDELYAECRDGP